MLVAREATASSCSCLYTVYIAQEISLQPKALVSLCHGSWPMNACHECAAMTHHRVDVIVVVGQLCEAALGGDVVDVHGTTIGAYRRGA